MQNIFKIVDSALYEKATAAGRFEGAEIDLKDGFIHFSDSHQVRETARLHFSGPRGLMIFAVDASWVVRRQDDAGLELLEQALRGEPALEEVHHLLELRHPIGALHVVAQPRGVERLLRTPGVGDVGVNAARKSTLLSSSAW